MNQHSPMQLSHEKLLIVDFGSQVTKLIARRVRENGVYSEIHPFYQVNQHFLNKFQAKAIILSGGPSSLTALDAPRANPAIWNAGVPVLGICYGQQLMCAQLGGSVDISEAREFGRASLHIDDHTPLFDELSKQQPVWMSHGDKVTSLPDGFTVIGKSDNAPYAAVADITRQFYGVQFHPEVIHTKNGHQILRNFTHKIAHFKGDWNMTAFKQEAIDAIRTQVGADAQVICALSGGVDSSVAAILIHAAIGQQLSCIYVDTGMMRLGESEQVIDLFSRHYDIKLIHINARTEFLNRLQGVNDPEQKRKIIGTTFIDIFEREAQKIRNASFLAQGTLYPDIIESVSFDGGPSVTIKSHHNVGGLPERMNLELIEPLRELFKDEVRNLGQELGLHEDFIRRHPFPGPGLAIRCPGEVTQARLDILRKADALYLEQIQAHGLYDDIWQAFAVLLPVQTVGVMGDERTYEYVLALRAVTSTDGMTADYFPFSHDFLSQTATRIINEVRGVNRVVYDVTSKPPGTIEWE